ncbi:dUTP diphosphatase [Alkalihalophilus marmarensis]|jgi:dimeric dUTPase (all-alpha-NTP-PPase superfamily)|uniref:dUTP diphosphatase n=1 Tax=Alkalihalophilus marmarensis TaxID=521377 RepID=UPI00203CC628|nr:dUTP diphosphatase [Alkalihalophilus marmarensis]MCM3487879.1 dUTP diphosphatase [Alkalihalophilus marmarensis]
MNLSKLFEIQKVLRDKIGYQEEDKFDKMNLAAIVEMAECANEWRGFKYWSKDQEPRTIKEVVPLAAGIPIFSDAKVTNPLLGEYVDGLHFVLEEGIELYECGELDTLPTFEQVMPLRHLTISKQYKSIIKNIILLEDDFEEGELVDAHYLALLGDFFGLGEMLGFTWDQIEQAYLEKNKENHERQNNGY